MLALTLACSAVTGGRSDGPERSPVTSNTADSAGSNTITVTESEFDVSIEPSQPTAGQVTFVVRNEGHIPHDFRIFGNGVDEKTPMIAAGDSESFTVTLEPGTYNYVCTVEGHAMLGMEGTITIQAGSSD
jgi:uncharacterized cupredoxin-like copper-binding protein